MSSNEEKVLSLPSRQQMGLWVILRMDEINERGFSFYSSQFAEKYKRFAPKNIKSDSEEYGRFIGGILSGLSRSTFLRKLSGGRDKMWTLSEEVASNLEEYKKNVFKMKIYWS